jgi:hypothetical protein
VNILEHGVKPRPVEHGAGCAVVNIEFRVAETMFCGIFFEYGFLVFDAVAFAFGPVVDRKPAV